MQPAVIRTRNFGGREFALFRSRSKSLNRRPDLSEPSLLQATEVVQESAQPDNRLPPGLPGHPQDM